MKNMGIRTSNGTLNFLYRIFIADDGVREEDELDSQSSNKIEATLAESQEKIDRAVDNHFGSTSGKGRGKFKVEKSQMQDVKENTSKEPTTRESREDDGREIE